MFVNQKKRFNPQFSGAHCILPPSYFNPICLDDADWGSDEL